jgi:hypothetical protein
VTYLVLGHTSLTSPTSRRFTLQQVNSASSTPGRKPPPPSTRTKPYHTPYTIHHSPFTIHHSPFTIHHPPYLNTGTTHQLPERPAARTSWCYSPSAVSLTHLRTLFAHTRAPGLRSLTIWPISIPDSRCLQHLERNGGGFLFLPAQLYGVLFTKSNNRRLPARTSSTSSHSLSRGVDSQLHHIAPHHITSEKKNGSMVPEIGVSVSPLIPPPP